MCTYIYIYIYIHVEKHRMLFVISCLCYYSLFFVSGIFQWNYTLEEPLENVEKPTGDEGADLDHRGCSCQHGNEQPSDVYFKVEMRHLADLKLRLQCFPVAAAGAAYTLEEPLENIEKPTTPSARR